MEEASAATLVNEVTLGMENICWDGMLEQKEKTPGFMISLELPCPPGTGFIQVSFRSKHVTLGFCCIGHLTLHMLVFVFQPPRG